LLHLKDLGRLPAGLTAFLLDPPPFTSTTDGLFFADLHRRDLQERREDDLRQSGGSQGSFGPLHSCLVGNTRRAIDFYEGESIDDKALTALVRAAVTLNESTAES